MTRREEMETIVAEYQRITDILFGDKTERDAYSPEEQVLANKRAQLRIDMDQYIDLINEDIGFYDAPIIDQDKLSKMISEIEVKVPIHYQINPRSCVTFSKNKQPTWSTSKKDKE